MTRSTDTPATTTELETSAFRYSNDPRAMGDFLQLLGLSVSVSNDANTWLVMEGAGGSVSIHTAGAASEANAKAGKTDLVMITRDVQAFAAQLGDANADATLNVWDEAFGRQAVLGLRGREIMINEEQTDDYGYQVQPANPGPITVVTDVVTGNPDDDIALFALLGFRPAGTGADPAQATRLERSDGSLGGVVRLHRSEEPDAAGPDAVEPVMGFETAEDLIDVAERLRAAGFAPTLYENDAPHIEVIDPDGQPVTIGPARQG